MSTPNIVLITTDQHRADHVGWSHRSRFGTPHIDRIAEGMSFQNCVTVNPICMPARTALLTGRYPHQINTLSMSGDLPRGIPTFAQALQRAGYWTAAVGKLHWFQTWKWGAPAGNGIDLAGLNEFTRSFGFDRVWEAAGKQLAVRNRCDWARHLEERDLLDAYRNHVERRGANSNFAEQVEFTGDPWPFDENDYVDIVTGDRACDAIRERDPDAPLFLHASFCSPHAPFDPPQRYLDMVNDEPWQPVASGCSGDSALTDRTIERLRRLWRAYRAMLLCVDDQVGRIITTLEEETIADQTVVLFTSDHGEMFGDHGFFQKQRYQWQSVNVPLAIRDPRHLSSETSTAPVELTDVTATILDIAGLNPDQALARDWPAFMDRVPARSLMPLVRGEARDVRESAFSECQGEWMMVQDRRFKYVRRSPHAATSSGLPREELYDLRNDPDECRNVASEPSSSAVLTDRRERLLDLIADTPPVQTRYQPLLGPDGSDEYPLKQ